VNIFKWMFKTPSTPSLKAIFITGSAGERMQSVSRIDAIEQLGLQGDRYSVAKGFWQATDACQVTLISEDDLDKSSKGLSVELQRTLETGGHRRNLVISGIKTKALQGKTFRIGTALFRYHKPRPPCGYLEKIEGIGLGRALGKHSGVCLTVINSGSIMVGDRLHMIELESV
jgi:MOSC domain-containing protein YiiM